MIDKILGFLSAPVTTWIESSAKRKYMKEEGALAVVKAEVAFRIATLESKSERLLRNDLADSDYDSIAQQERRHTIADELLILWTLIVVTCHFFWPEYMQAGWEAMGYLTPPWWLEFIIVGIFVSVFGLMRLFRAFNPFGKKIVKEVL